MQKLILFTVFWAVPALAHNSQDIGCETALKLVSPARSPSNLTVLQQAELPDQLANGDLGRDSLMMITVNGKPTGLRSGGRYAPQLRLKAMTSGLHRDSDGTIDPRDEFIDAADPSAPFWLTLPDGRRVVRIYLSGLRYLQAANLDDILRGGIQTVRRIRGFYKDGTEMTGLYHEDSFPWDPELHVRPDGVLIGHGGVMAQAKAGETPKVRLFNQARTRMWAEVKFVRMSNGEFEEQWHFQGSLFGPPVFGRWVSPEHQHNYGATLFREADGSYVRDSDGNYFMIYERVTAERDGKPWNTEIFVRKLNSSMTAVEGPEHSVQRTTNPSGEPYRASQRNGGKDGFLFEGGRPIKWHDGRSWRWVVAFSGGDYVSTRYGFHLALSENSNPLSNYAPVVDAQGEVVDFAESLRCLLNATWGPGRPSLFYDERGQMWALFHFISKDQIPDGEVKDGWPATAEEFVKRFRRVGVVPVTLKMTAAGPKLTIEIGPAKNSKIEQKLRLCSGL